jgi:hypothetical protein
MSRRNAIQTAFDDYGKYLGAKKQSGSWYVGTAEVISVCNLQKSQYGPSYYFNQGFYLRTLNHLLEFPRVHQCHIQGRFEDFVPARTQEIRRLLDFEYLVDDQERSLELLSLLCDTLGPIVRDASSLDDVRRMALAGTFGDAPVSLDGLNALGLPAPS